MKYNENLVIFVILLVLLFIILMFQSSYKEPFEAESDLPPEVNLASVLSNLNTSYDSSMYKDPTLGTNKNISTRPCNVYYVSDTNSEIDDTLRYLCDSGFFDKSRNAIINRKNILNASLQAGTITPEEGVELKYIHWYELIKPLLPNGACKVSLHDWVEPTSTHDGQAYPIKNAVNAMDHNRGNPKDWAYCYKPLIVQNDKNKEESAFIEGSTIADGIEILASSNVMQPFTDDKDYAQIAFSTFNLNDYNELWGNPSKKNNKRRHFINYTHNINNNICSTSNISGNVNSVIPQDGSFLVFTLDDKNHVADFSPAQYEPSTQYINKITDTSTLFNIYTYLFTIEFVGNQVLLVPNNFSATIYNFQTDICIRESHIRERLFHHSGRLIKLYDTTPLTFSLATNMGIQNKVLHQSTGPDDITFGHIPQLQERLLTFQVTQKNLQQQISDKQQEIAKNNTHLQETPLDAVFSIGITNVGFISIRPPVSPILQNMLSPGKQFKITQGKLQDGNQISPDSIFTITTFADAHYDASGWFTLTFTPQVLLHDQQVLSISIIGGDIQQQIQYDNIVAIGESQLVNLEQSLITNLRNQTRIIETILAIDNAFNNQVANISRTFHRRSFINIDYNKESNDGNLYIYIGPFTNNYSQTGVNVYQLQQLLSTIHSLIISSNRTISAAQAQEARLRNNMMRSQSELQAQQHRHHDLLERMNAFEGHLARDTGKIWKFGNQVAHKLGVDKVFKALGITKVFNKVLKGIRRRRR